MTDNKKLGKKAVIIGLDGVPYSLLTEYMERGIMPKFKEIAATGRLLPMHSSLPEVSSVAWASFLTGKNPAEHGIFGFMEIDKQTYGYTFPNFAAVKTPLFWEELNVPAVAINVPQTYPARPTDGVIISGFVAIDMKKAVYPPKLYDYLKSIDYRLDVNTQLAGKDNEAFFKEVFYAFEKRTEAIKYLYKNQDWQLFIAAVTETDRLHHYFFDSAKAGKYHAIFADFYARLDQFLYEMYSLAQNDQALFLTCSDHGFTEVKTEVYVNRYLMDHGLLKIDGGEGFSGMTRESRAFCLEPARVYVHRQGAYSRGAVAEADYEKVRQELKGLFESLEFENKKVVEKVFLKEQIFSGKFMEDAPDLYILGKPGFDLKSMLKKPVLFDTSKFTGAHTYNDAHVYISEPGKQIKVNFSIQDVSLLL